MPELDFWKNTSTKQEELTRGQSAVAVVSEWSITDFKIVDFDKLYYEQINGCEVTDGPFADHSGTIVIADSGPLALPPQKSSLCVMPDYNLFRV